MSNKSLVIAAALALIAVPAGAQSTSIDLAAGFQWVQVDGNEDQFRTQVNEEDGVILGHLQILHLDPSSTSGVDRLRIDAAGFGGHPEGRFRFEMGAGDLYELRLSYRQSELFAAPYGWADPDQDGLGQHRYQRDFSAASLELEILPGRTFTPMVAYRHYDTDSNGLSTWHIGQDEFQLVDRQDRSEEEIEVGVAFHAGSWSGRLVQGWRSIDQDTHLSVLGGAEEGGSLSFLGVDPSVDRLERRAETDIDAPVTRADLRGRLGDRVRVGFTALVSNRETDFSADDLADGDLVSYAVNRFFTGFADEIRSDVDEEYYDGRLDVETRLTDSIDLDFSFFGRTRDVDGLSVIRTLYTGTSDFGGTPRPDLQVMADVENAFNRSDRGGEIRFSARDLGPVRLWVGTSFRSEELEVQEDPVEYVLPWGQEIDAERDVDGLVGGLGLDFGMASVSAEFRTEEADRSLLRTDWLDRDRLRVRGTLTPLDGLRILATFATEEAETDDRYGFETEWETDQLGFGLEWDTCDAFTLYASWDEYDTETQVPIIVPQTLLPELSVFSDETSIVEIGGLFTFAKVSLDLGVSDLESEGSVPLEFFRGWLRGEVGVTDAISWLFEVDRWDSSDELNPGADYDATRYALLMRWRN